jgi:hypothetical protein
MEKFAHLVPSLARQLAKARCSWVVTTCEGPIRMKRSKAAEWRAVDAELDDGSRLTDTWTAIGELRGRLAKRRGGGLMNPPDEPFSLLPQRYATDM